MPPTHLVLVHHTPSAQGLVSTAMMLKIQVSWGLLPVFSGIWEEVGAFKILVNSYSVTLCHILEDLNPCSFVFSVWLGWQQFLHVLPLISTNFQTLQQILQQT